MRTYIVCLILLLVMSPSLIHMLEQEESPPVSTFDCEEGQFRCGEARQCVSQNQICDNDRHCHNGWDEEPAQCHAVPAFIHFWVTNFTRFPSNFSIEQIEARQKHCELEDVPHPCRCGMETVYCNNTDMVQIPTDFPHATVRLQLYENNICSLETGAFKGLHQLTLLNLGWNQINQIQPGAFEGLTKVKRLMLNNNKLQILEGRTFSGMSSLKELYLDHNSISRIEGTAFYGLNKLIWLDMGSNELTFNTHGMPQIKTLRVLNLGSNQIQKLPANMFSKNNSLHTLELRHNEIKRVDAHVFKSMTQLQDLDLSSNEIGLLPDSLFTSNTHLHTIRLEHNPLRNLPVTLFNGLLEAKIMKLSGVTIENIQPEMFKPMTNLEHIYFKNFHYCAYAPHVPDCYPKSDGISSIENLLGMTILRVCIWVVAMVTTIGNIFVMVTRSVLKEENLNHSLLVRNLCASDLLMGVYLLIIGTQDIRFRDNYNAQAYSWMVSWCCQATGALGMLSCEVSILLLTYMSVERYIIISHPYRPWKISWKSTALIISSIWILGLTLSTLPLMTRDKFGVFYGTNGLCFPLHIHEPYQTGWQYSAFVFLGVNFCAICMTSVAYCGMFMKIVNTRRKSTICNDEDTLIAKRIFWIVLTDSLCWIPIITIKVMALFSIPITDDAYAWLAVFVLPINSAINPLLYSFTAATFRRKLNTLLQTKRRNSDLFRAIVKMVRRHSSNSSRLSTSTKFSIQMTSSAILDLHTLPLSIGNNLTLSPSSALLGQVASGCPVNNDGITPMEPLLCQNDDKYVVEDERSNTQSNSKDGYQEEILLNQESCVELNNIIFCQSELS